jgi:hypothetical protein
MRSIVLTLLVVLLNTGCSTSIAPASEKRPQFDIRSSDVVKAIVRPSTDASHKAEIDLFMTGDCVKRYEPFGRRYEKQLVNILANGRPLLTNLEAPAHWDTKMTVYIFTSVEDAQSLTDSLNKK